MAAQYLSEGFAKNTACAILLGKKKLKASLKYKQSSGVVYPSSLRWLLNLLTCQTKLLNEGEPQRKFRSLSLCVAKYWLCYYIQGSYKWFRLSSNQHVITHITNLYHRREEAINSLSCNVVPCSSSKAITLLTAPMHPAPLADVPLHSSSLAQGHY